MYSIENGFIPRTFNQIMNELMGNININFGLNYTEENFIGTNFYKFCYSIAESIVEQDVMTQNIYEHYLNYVTNVNLKINTPVCTIDNLLEKFDAEDIEVGFMENDDTNCGTIYMSVNLDESGNTENEQKIGQILSENTSAGTAFVGTKSVDIALSNGQAFTYKWELANLIPAQIKITFTLSDVETGILTEQEVKDKFIEMVTASYRLGNNFEPQRFCNVNIYPFASECLLEYSLDSGSTWLTDVYVSNYDDKLTFDPDDIIVNYV